VSGAAQSGADAATSAGTLALSANPAASNVNRAFVAASW